MEPTGETEPPTKKKKDEKGNPPGILDHRTGKKQARLLGTVDAIIRVDECATQGVRLLETLLPVVSGDLLGNFTSCLGSDQAAEMAGRTCVAVVLDAPSPPPSLPPSLPPLPSPSAISPPQAASPPAPPADPEVISGLSQEAGASGVSVGAIAAALCCFGVAIAAIWRRRLRQLRKHRDSVSAMSKPDIPTLASTSAHDADVLSATSDSSEATAPAAAAPAAALVAAAPVRSSSELPGGGNAKARELWQKNIPKVQSAMATWKNDLPEPHRLPAPQRAVLTKYRHTISSRMDEVVKSRESSTTRRSMRTDESSPSHRSSRDTSLGSSSARTQALSTSHRPSARDTSRLASRRSARAGALPPTGSTAWAGALTPTGSTAWAGAPSASPIAASPSTAGKAHLTPHEIHEVVWTLGPRRASIESPGKLLRRCMSEGTVTDGIDERIFLALVERGPPTVARSGPVLRAESDQTTSEASAGVFSRMSIENVADVDGDAEHALLAQSASVSGTRPGSAGQQSLLRGITLPLVPQQSNDDGEDRARHRRTSDVLWLDSWRMLEVQNDPTLHAGRQCDGQRARADVASVTGAGGSGGGGRGDGGPGPGAEAPSDAVPSAAAGFSGEAVTAVVAAPVAPSAPSAAPKASAPVAAHNVGARSKPSNIPTLKGGMFAESPQRLTDEGSSKIETVLRV